MTANNTIVDGDAPYLSYTFAQPFRAERLRSLLDGRTGLTVESLAGMQADTVSVAARGWGRVLGSLGPFDDGGRRGGAVTAGRVRRGPRGRVGGRAAVRLLLRALAAGLYRPILGPDTWEWVASGRLAPTMSLIRRWLGNDTWELLGMPGRAGPGRRSAVGRRRRAEASGCSRRSRGAGLGVGGGRRARRAGSSAVAVG